MRVSEDEEKVKNLRKLSILKFSLRVFSQPGHFASKSDQSFLIFTGRRREFLKGLFPQ